MTNLKLLLNVRNTSISKLAKEVDVKPEIIEKIIENKFVASLPLREKISNNLKFPIDFFLIDKNKE